MGPFERFRLRQVALALTFLFAIQAVAGAGDAAAVDTGLLSLQLSALSHWAFQIGGEIVARCSLDSTQIKYGTTIGCDSPGRDRKRDDYFSWCSRIIGRR